MAKGGIKISLKGFDRMLEELQQAGGDVDRAASSAIRESAKIVEDELQAAVTASGVPSDITSEIRTNTSKEGDRYEAEVGWIMENYDPKKPTAGYKAVFMNFGTVKRYTRKDHYRGEIQKQPRAQQFIYRAKKNARPKVKKIQRQEILKALGGLEK